jgi:hypothetical protein
MNEQLCALSVLSRRTSGGCAVSFCSAYTIGPLVSFIKSYLLRMTGVSKCPGGEAMAEFWYAWSAGLKPLLSTRKPCGLQEQTLTPKNWGRRFFLQNYSMSCKEYKQIRTTDHGGNL